MKIKELKLLTANLSHQTAFYSNKIGLELIEKNDNQVKFQIGKSILTFIKSKELQPYHFAINIPSNLEKEALEWLRKRVEILKDGEHEIQDFEFWNAKAIYFYDEDKNIVELIARKNLRNESDEPFNRDSFLSISEIGVPVNDIPLIFYSLTEIVNLQKYDGGLERFLAVGDENGLFIIINKNEKNWFPTGDQAYSSAFEIHFEEKEMAYHLRFKDGKIQ